MFINHYIIIYHHRSVSVVLCVNLIDRRRSRRNPAGAGLPLVRYTRPAPHKWYMGHYWSQFTWQVYQNQNYVKLALVPTLLKFTRLASRKSYLVIIGPKDHDIFTKGVTRSSWNRLEYCSESSTSVYHYLPKFT